MKLEEIVLSGISELGVELPDGAMEKLRAYYELLTLRGAEMNLTAIKGEEDAANLHFLDCLGLLRCCDFSGSIVDVGTGAGFPGVPLAIARPDLQITLMDSTEKKINFLREVSETVNVPARCVHARAEEAGQDAEFRESFDFAVSRAVARLSLLCELTLPLVRPGGKFVAMKSADSDEEIKEAAKAIKILGGAPAKIEEYKVPGTDIVRRAVIIEKTAHTDKKYPRRFAKMQKSPL